MSKLVKAQPEMTEANDTLTFINTTCVDDDWMHYDDFVWWINGFGSLLVGLIGIILNLASSTILLSSDLAANFFNWLLVCLALFDNVFLLTSILEAIRNHFGSTSIVHYHAYAVFLYPFQGISLCCSIYMTVILALERYMAFERLRNGEHHCRSLKHCNTIQQQRNLWDHFKVHRIRLFKYVGPIVLLSAIFCIPRWMETHAIRTQNCLANGTTVQLCTSYEYDIVISVLRLNKHYILWYKNILYLLVTVIVPIASLIYLNGKIYIQFKQHLCTLQNLFGNNQTSDMEEMVLRREESITQQTRILFAIVIIFVLTQAPRVILDIHEFKNTIVAAKSGCPIYIHFWVVILVPISELFLAINSSINFVIYGWFSHSFKKVVMTKALALWKLFGTQSNNSETSNANLNETACRAILLAERPQTTQDKTGIEETR